MQGHPRLPPVEKKLGHSGIRVPHTPVATGHGPPSLQRFDPGAGSRPGLQHVDDFNGARPDAKTRVEPSVTHVLKRTRPLENTEYLLFHVERVLNCPPPLPD